MPSHTAPNADVGDLVAVRFLVLADAAPGLLPRLLQPFAKRDLTPDAFHSMRDGDVMRVEIALHAMPAGMVQLAAGNLGQVVGVQSVQTRRGGDAVLLAA